MRPSLRRYLLAQRISAATPTATMSKMVNSGNPKPNGIRSTPCFLWDGRFPATERFVPNVSAGGASPFHHRRTDTNTNSVAWANPSALLQRLAYPTPGDCQAQTRRRTPSVPLAVIPTLMTVIPAKAGTYPPAACTRKPHTRQSPLARTPPPCATMDPDRPSRAKRRGWKEDEAGKGAAPSSPIPASNSPKTASKRLKTASKRPIRPPERRSK